MCQDTPVLSRIYIYMKKPILEYIRDHYRDGMLDEGFSMEEYQTGEASFSFIDGAMDGICFFHSDSSSDGELFRFIRDHLDLQEGDDVDEAFEELELHFENYQGSLIGTEEEIRRYLIEHASSLNQDLIFRLGCRLVREGTAINSVKYGLILLGMFRSDLYGDMLDDLMMLALSDEFTLFVSVCILESLPDRNERRFELAKKVLGWGRIFLILGLDNDSDEIEEWLLTEGGDNMVSLGYASPMIMEKLDLHQIFHRQLSDREVSGLCSIIRGLLFDAPLSDLNDMENRDQIVEGILAMRPWAKNNADYYSLLLEMQYWCEVTATEEESEFLSQTCRKVREQLEDEHTSDFLRWHLPNCDFYDFNRLCEVALINPDQRMDDIINERFEKDPIMCNGAIGYLMERGYEKWVRSILDKAQLSENDSPFELPGLNLLLQQLGRFPFLGTRFVVEGLKSRFMMTRFIAVQVIRSWLEIDHEVRIIEYPDELYEALVEMRDHEEVDTLKEQASAILESDRLEDPQGSRQQLPS